MTPVGVLRRKSLPDTRRRTFDGLDDDDSFDRVAALVNRNLKRSQPLDLPFEKPRFFKFVINAKTTKVLGLEILPPVLADEEPTLPRLLRAVRGTDLLRCSVCAGAPAESGIRGHLTRQRGASEVGATAQSDPQPTWRILALCDAAIALAPGSAPNSLLRIFDHLTAYCAVRPSSGRGTPPRFAVVVGNMRACLSSFDHPTGPGTSDMLRRSARCSKCGLKCASLHIPGAGQLVMALSFMWHRFS